MYKNLAIWKNFKNELTKVREIYNNETVLWPVSKIEEIFDPINNVETPVWEGKSPISQKCVYPVTDLLQWANENGVKGVFWGVSFFLIISSCASSL